MLIRHWLRSLFARPSVARRAKRRRQLARRTSVAAEQLEQRAMLTDFVVSTATDEDNGATDAATALADGDGLSLREAIRLSNENNGVGAGSGNGDGDRIFFETTAFAGGATINLTLGDLLITDDVSIANELAADANDDGLADAGGTGTAFNLTIEAGGNNDRIFTVNVAPVGGQHNVAVTNIDPANNLFVLQNGDAGAEDGGAILHSTISAAIPSTLTVTSVDFLGNTAANGGAIASNAATNAVTETVIIGGSFLGNSATTAGGAIANTGANSVMDISGAQIGNDAAEAADFWERTGAAVGDLVFGYVDTQNSLDQDSTLRVLADDGTTAIEFDDDGGPGVSSVVAGAVVPQAGSVFFDVRHFNTPSPMSYDLYTAVVDPAAVDNVTEDESVQDNDSAANATAIVENVLVSGDFDDDAIGESDFYSFTANAGDRIVVMLDKNPDDGGGNTTADIFLLGTDGTTILATGRNTGGESDAVGAFTVDANGTYFLKLENGGGDTDYRLVLQVHPALSATPESEPNDDTATADLLGGDDEFGTGELAILPNVSNTALRGGGILNAGTLTVDDTHIAGNSATGNASTDGGGGIYNTGTLNIVNTTGASEISFNTAAGTSGSGGGLFSASGTVMIDGASIRFNEAVRAGGGIEVVDGMLTMTSSILSRNDVSASIGGLNTANPGNGGGLHVSGTSGTVVTLDNTIVGNNTAGLEGGGLWNQAGSTLIVQNGTVVSDNRTTDSSGADKGGGGIFNNGGTLTIDGTANTVSVVSNRANDDDGTNPLASGGGILTIGGMVTITDANISRNEAIRAGGGIEIIEGTVTLTNTTVNGNDVSAGNAILGTALGASPGNGGGIHVTGAANVTINGGSVSNNDAGREGGGIWNSASGTLLIRGGTMVNGNSTESAPDAHDGGGGIFNDGGTLTIDGDDASGPLAAGQVQINNNVANNTATNDNASGGGLLTIGGTVSITNATITGNEAIRAGGGIEIIDGTLNVTDVNLNDNDVSVVGLPAAPGNGGGLHVSGTSGTVVTIDGGTVSGNRAGREGGGLWNQVGSTLIVQNGTLIDDNSTSSNSGPGGDDGGGGIFNNGGTLTIDGTATTVDITNNIANDDDTMGNARASGGGILSVGGMVTITDANISGNEAIRAGGGIEIVEGTLTITNTSINANDVSVAGGELALAAPGNGGGIHVTGAANVTINGGSVSNNDAGREGGGLWNSATGSLLIRSGTLVNGNSTEAAPDVHDGGGGIFNDGGTLTIDGDDATGPLAAGEVQINDNKANNTATNDNASGGGLLSLGGTVTVTNATFQSNEAIRAGGGIEIVDGTLTLTDVNIDGNDVSVEGNQNIPPGNDIEHATPGNGGGLHVTAAATVTIDGGTVNNNSAGREGGGLWNSATGTLNITGGTTINGNVVHRAFGDDDGGGGIFNNGGTLTIDDVGGAVAIGGNVARSGAFGQIAVINEFLADPPLGPTGDANGDGNSDQAEDEFIEIVNTSGAPLDISDWTLGDDDGTPFVFPTNTVLAAGQAAVLFGGGTPTGTFGGALVFTDDGAIGTQLANGGDLIELRDDIGALIASVGYGTQGGDGQIDAGDANNDQSRTRDPDLFGPFVDHSDAPGSGGTLFSPGTTANGASFVVGGGASGGGILSTGGTVTITGADITQNEAIRAGGGIEIVEGTLTLTDVNLDFNDVSADGGTIEAAAPGNGGGLHVTAAANVTIDGGTVNSNAAANEGGGLWNSATGTLVVRNGTTIDGNTASGTQADAGGGGIFNEGGTLTITGAATTISGNSANGAAGSGGGILTVGGTVSVTDATIETNDARRAGGGIEVRSFATAATVTLTNVTLHENSTAAAPGNGGGLHVTAPAGGQSTTVTIDGGSITDNTASAEGGGLWNDANGTLIITDVSGAVTISGNEAAGNAAPGAGNVDVQGGGGIFNNGGTLEIRDENANELVQITLNTATGADNGSGGGILTTGGTVTIQGVIIEGNEAVRAGGGIEVVNSNVTITDSLVTTNDVSTLGANSAANPGNGGGIHIGGGTSAVDVVGSIVELNTAEQGGGLWVGTGSTLNVHESTVRMNLALEDGGGLYNAGGSFNVDRSTFSANSVSIDGGGIAQGVLPSGQGTIVNSTISGNDAGVGGGIYTENGTILIQSSTIADNDAAIRGGGVATAGGTVTFQNTIVGDQPGGDDQSNTAGIAEADISVGTGAANSNGFNLVADPGFAFSNGIQATDNIGGDPNLGLLADNGGPTITHLPGPGSAAIDQGNSNQPGDQRGVPRPQGAQDDIGAVELVNTSNLSLIGLRGGSTLVIFAPNDPTVILATVEVTGLGGIGAADEQLIGIDTSVLDGMLYGVTDANGLYTINPITGVATLVDILTQGLNDDDLVAIAAARHFHISSLGLFEEANPGLKWIRGDVNEFGNPWYFIDQFGNLFASDGTLSDGDILLARLGTNAYENLELIVGAGGLMASNPGELAAADEMRAFYRSTRQDFRFNDFGGNEKWIKGRVDAKAVANQNNPWYYILPTGAVFEWDGTPSTLSGTQIGITPDPTIWEDPSLLFDAFQDPTVDSAGFDDLQNFVFANVYNAVRNIDEGFGGLDAKWFLGDVHAGGNDWYFLLPNGDLFEWDGTPNTASGNLLGNLGPNAWNNIERVVDDGPGLDGRADADQLMRLDQELELYRSSRDRNYFSTVNPGLKWFRGKINEFGNPWYFVNDAGELRASAGGGASSLIEMLSGDVFDDPSLLVDAYADGSVRNTQGDGRGDRLNLQSGLDDGAVGLDVDLLQGPMGLLTSLQLVSTNNLNLNIDARNGETTVGPNVNPGAARLAALAFDGLVSFNPDLPFAIDSLNPDTLNTLNPANGQTSVVGALNVDSNDLNGLEAIGDPRALDGVTYASLTVGGTASLYMINTTTGNATLVGLIGTGFDDLHDITQLLMPPGLPT